MHDNTDDQIYNPDRYNLSDSSLSRLLSNLSSIWNVIMVNSEKKIFQSFYATEAQRPTSAATAESCIITARSCSPTRAEATAGYWTITTAIQKR